LTPLSGNSSVKAGAAAIICVSLSMDKSALVQTLAMSEKNHSMVTIKIINAEKPVIGAVQKVLNQVIILKSSADEQITLTFGDIEAVNGQSDSFFGKLIRNFSKILHRLLRLSNA
jgi:hypothetical protein